MEIFLINFECAASSVAFTFRFDSKVALFPLYFADSFLFSLKNAKKERLLFLTKFIASCAVS